jgi:hypothetical protein
VAGMNAWVMAAARRRHTARSCCLSLFNCMVRQLGCLLLGRVNRKEGACACGSGLAKAREIVREQGAA